MKSPIYVVRDIKADYGLQPFCAPNDAVAMRMLSGSIQNKETDLGRYPEDFELHRIGMYDNEKCLITQTEDTQVICNAGNLVKAEE
jgi:hypothetical protein